MLCFYVMSGARKSFQKFWGGGAVAYQDTFLELSVWGQASKEMTAWPQALRDGVLCCPCGICPAVTTHCPAGVAQGRRRRGQIGALPEAQCQRARTMLDVRGMTQA